MLFKWHREIFTSTLGGRLSVKALYSLFSTVHRRRPGRREKQKRNNTTNNCAAEILVVRQISQRRPDGGAGHRELDRSFTQTLFEFAQVDIEPGARITDNDKGVRLHNATSKRPKILVIVKRRAIAERAAVQLPRRSRGDDSDGDRNGDS